MTEPVSVRGGTGGVEAHYDDMTAAARLFGRAAGDTEGAALALHGCLIDPDVLGSAVLDPVGAAHFEAQLVAALDGPAGVTWLAARCTAIDLGLRAAAAGYLSADRLDERLAPEFGAISHAPRALYDGVTTLAEGDVAGALQKVITDDPQLADVGVGIGAELFGAKLFGAGSASLGAHLLGLPFDDGAPRVTTLGVDAAADATGPPRSLADLLAGLARRNEGVPGEVDVRFLRGVDAAGHPTRAVVVDIPGTKDWSPALHNGDVTSIATNLRAIAGEVTTYERGVIEAMRQAGVCRDDAVLLVGHSEGGMVAVNAARQLARTGEFAVTHVVTAGAPLGLIAGKVPARTNVLALENEGDVVPHLDGAENPDRVNITTVTTHRDHGDIVDNHDLERSYVPAAVDVDESDDPSVRAYLAGLSGFLTAATVTTRGYEITRTYR